MSIELSRSTSRFTFGRIPTVSLRSLFGDAGRAQVRTAGSGSTGSSKAPDPHSITSASPRSTRIEPGRRRLRLRRLRKGGPLSLVWGRVILKQVLSHASIDVVKSDSGGFADKRPFTSLACSTTLSPDRQRLLALITLSSGSS